MCVYNIYIWWSDDPLKHLFRKGLSRELQSELACRGDGKSLDQFIDLAIRIDNLVRSQRQPRFSSASAGMTSLPEPEPMQIGFTHLSMEERERERETYAPKSLFILRPFWTQESFLSASQPFNGESKFHPILYIRDTSYLKG